MRIFGLATSPMLHDLTASDSAGERLAAIASLQVRPDANLLEWLATRLASETPFVGYQAAVALRVAARTLDPPHHDAVRRAIELASKATTDGTCVLNHHHFLFLFSSHFCFYFCTFLCYTFLTRNLSLCFFLWVGF